MRIRLRHLRCGPLRFAPEACVKLPAKMVCMSIVIPRLILASASPRRRELLAQAGFVFDVIPAHIPEEPRPGEDPEAYVMRLAREKAEAVFDGQVEEGQREEGTEGQRDGIVVLGADTTVTLDGHILEKPCDADDAKRMLRILSGRTHLVITGVAVVDSNGIRVAAETTAVWFAELTEDEIAEYVATGEPMDKAGAYGIQGRAAKWIPRIEGCYFNVVGLPLALVSSMLETVIHRSGEAGTDDRSWTCPE
jgi:septum formation protein